MTKLKDYEFFRNVIKSLYRSPVYTGLFLLFKTNLKWIPSPVHLYTMSMVNSIIIEFTPARVYAKPEVTPVIT